MFWWLIVVAVLVVILLAALRLRRLRDQKKRPRLLRVLRSKQAPVTGDEFVDYELQDKRLGGPDLRPSVYEVHSDGELVRAYSEHLAASGLGPPGALHVCDLAGLGPHPKTTEADGPFEFLNSRHRELVVSSPTELRNLAAAAVASCGGRSTRVEKSTVSEYVRSRLNARDNEWHRALSNQKPSQKKKWVALAFRPLLLALKNREQLVAAASSTRDRSRTMSELRQQRLALEADRAAVFSWLNS